MRFRGVCWGGWVDEATTHEEKGENRRGESKKKNQEYLTPTLLVYWFSLGVEVMEVT